jgi:hypothetical protein
MLAEQLPLMMPGALPDGAYDRHDRLLTLHCTQLSSNDFPYLREEEKQMMKLSRMRKFVLLLCPLALSLATGTYAQDQYPILDKLAAKVIEKYQTTPCEQLLQKKAQPEPPSPQQVKVIQFLKSDPQMRVVFINKVAAPIANKMFECGMIP